MIAMRTSDRLDIANLPSDYGIGLPAADTASRKAPPEPQSLNPLEKAERTALLREIDANHGNISRVAQRLGIGRNTLYRKMRRLGITFPARQNPRR
jgi:transcriptional regulator of acetoin/glycerol metabolism